MFCGLFLMITLTVNANKCLQIDSLKRPHIIFIYADDWAWAGLSSHGSTWLKTPNLDRLVKEGSDFSRFNVLNPVCSPSRAALLTGRYPARYSIHEHFAGHKNSAPRQMPDWLDPEAPTLPRILKASGYATAHYGKWHLTNNDLASAPDVGQYGYDDYAGWNGIKPVASFTEIFDKTLDFVQKAEKEDKPAFVNLWIHEAHTPHVPSNEAMDAFSGLTEQQQVYAAVIKDGDDGVGKILAGLDRMGLAENTIIFFSSDNGPERTGNDKKMEGGLGTYYSVGETGGLKGRKRSLYEGGIRVPFIVRWAGKVPANYTDSTSEITAVDILPTVCRIAGAKIPESYQADGEDRLSVLFGKPAAHSKPIFWDWRGNSAGANWPRSAINDGGWKLLIDKENRVELYNLKIDNKEQHDISLQNPDIVSSLRKKIDDWKATLPAKPDPKCISH